MKKLLLLVLTLTMILSLAACTKKEPELTLDQKKDQVKQNVIHMLGDDSDGRQDPSELLSDFTGDYQVSSISAVGTDYAPSALWKKGNVSVTEMNGNKQYTVYQDGKAYIISEANGEFNKDYDYETTYISNLFSEFEVDLSAFMQSEDSETPQMPDLTANDLTVSDDLTTCTISDTFLKEFAKSLCTSMDMEEAEQEAFLASYTGSGSFNVAENKLTIEISGTSEATGALKLAVVASETAADGFTMTMTIEMSMKQEEMLIPMTVTMAYKNVKWDGNKVVSGVLSLTTSATVDQTVEGITMKMSMDQTLTATVNRATAGKPSISIVSEAKQIQEMGENKQEDAYKITFNCDLSKTSDVLVCEMLEDGETVKITAQSVMLGNIDSTVPAKVTELAK